MCMERCSGLRTISLSPLKDMDNPLVDHMKAKMANLAYNSPVLFKKQTYVSKCVLMCLYVTKAYSVQPYKGAFKYLKRNILLCTH